MITLDTNTLIGMYLMLSMIMHVVLTLPPRPKMVQPLYQHPYMVWPSIVMGPFSLIYLYEKTRDNYVQG